LRKGERAQVACVGVGASPELMRRLMEMGFLEGAIVEILHEAPYGGDPIAVRVRGATLALRRNEANAIQVSVL
jgi:ferrous iron transport protein A